jgi:hypothetical protein
MKNYEDEITIPNVQKQKEEPKTLCIAKQKNSEYLERSEKVMTYKHLAKKTFLQCK